MPAEVQIMIVIMGALAFSSTVWSLVVFKMKKKELEMRGGDPELGPVVDALREDLADMQEHTRSTVGRDAGTPRRCRTLAHRRTRTTSG